MSEKIIKLLSIALFGFGAANIQAQVCTPAPIGLISSYSGDNNALDARARNNGTIQGNVSYAAGQVGQGVQLGGMGDTSGNGDRIVVGNPADLRRQDFTIEAWVKRSSATILTNSPVGSSPNGTIFAYGQGGYGFFIDQNTNKLGLTQIGFSNAVAPTLTITDTNWHHVAVTLSGPPFTGGTQTIFYLDGVADTPVGYAPQFSFTTNAAIGARGDNDVRNAFFGAIDELSIYDRALSAAQIQAIFNSGTAGKCKPLATLPPDRQILWLAGDGDALDSTGNGNNGTLQNGAAHAVGRVGQGFTFDGADDQITIPDNANQNGGTNLTIEAWINPSSLPHGGTILQKRTSGNIGGYLFEPTQPSGGGQPNGLQFVISIGGVYQFLNPANVVLPNVWQHVAATYDGAVMRIYVNGVEVANKPQTGAIDNVAAPIIIGRNAVGNNQVGFSGAIDEISVYNRALTADEIQSISNAGIAGKYKVQATVPANIAAWYPGDGSTNDLQAANDGTLQGGATYAGGKVGQAFSLNGTNAYVTAPSTPANEPTGATGASMEAWVQFNQRPSDAGHSFFIISKDGSTFGASDAFHLRADTDNYIKFQWQGGVATTTAVSVQTGVWYHVVGTYSPTEPVCRFYINGVFMSTGACTATPRTPSSQPFFIGRNTQAVGNTLFNGLIDEPAIYNRTLSEAEIRDQYYAGSLGKYKGSSNPTAHNTTKTGDATGTFGTITTAGSVHQTPLDMTLLPALPTGTNTGLNYDISTSAAYMNPTVCLNMSSFTSAQFSNLRIYHLESGVWQNRTAASNSYPSLCSSGLTSLSPFSIVSVSSTVTNVSVSGRVTGIKGGLNNVSVTISGGNLPAPVTIQTSSFGYYTFENLNAGETYFVTVSAKRYTFSPNTRVVSPNQDVSDLDFTAENP